MSASATPISSARFAAALVELPLPSLHAKAAEIRNSIAHLEISNNELRNYAVAGDLDCADAMRENIEVIDRMKERLGLLKKEVEHRGYMWDDYESSTDGKREDSVDAAMVDQLLNAHPNGSHNQTEDVTASNAERTGERLNDEELARLLHQRLDGHDADSAGGIHL